MKYFNFRSTSIVYPATKNKWTQKCTQCTLKNRLLNSDVFHPSITLQHYKSQEKFAASSYLKYHNFPFLSVYDTERFKFCFEVCIHSFGL